jgi:hypothetical protein
MSVGSAMVWCAGFSALCFVLLLIFLTIVIVRRPDCLPDVAKAIRAYRRRRK